MAAVAASMIVNLRNIVYLFVARSPSPERFELNACEPGSRQCNSDAFDPQRKRDLIFARRVGLYPATGTIHETHCECPLMALNMPR